MRAPQILILSREQAEQPGFLQQEVEAMLAANPKADRIFVRVAEVAPVSERPEHRACRRHS